MGGKEKVFSKNKTKQTKKTILKLNQMKKTLPFHDALCHFVLYFSTARKAALPLRNKR